MRLIFVPRSIERPKVPCEVHAVDGTVLTVAPDGQNQIQPGASSRRHQRVGVQKIDPNGIGVLRGVAFQIHVNGVQSKRLCKSLQLNRRGNNFGLTAIRIAAVPRKRHASQSGVLVGQDGVESKGRVNDRSPPRAIRRGIHRQQRPHNQHHAALHQSPPSLRMYGQILNVTHGIEEFDQEDPVRRRCRPKAAATSCRVKPSCPSGSNDKQMSALP